MVSLGNFCLPLCLTLICVNRQLIKLRSWVRIQVRASFFDEIAKKVALKNENVTLDYEMRESHQLCEDMFIYSKVCSS